jgi:hypothetical protein
VIALEFALGGPEGAAGGAHKLDAEGDKMVRSGYDWLVRHTRQLLRRGAAWADVERGVKASRRARPRPRAPTSPQHAFTEPRTSAGDACGADRRRGVQGLRAAAPAPPSLLRELRTRARPPALRRARWRAQALGKGSLEGFLGVLEDAARGGARAEAVEVRSRPVPPRLPPSAAGAGGAAQRAGRRGCVCGGSDGSGAERGFGR